MSSRASHDQLGGSTYTFDVWPGHPHESEVMDTLNHFRSRNTALRQKVQQCNTINGVPPNMVRVTCYLGQNYVEMASLQVAIEEQGK